MKWVKPIGLTFLFGLLSVATVVAGVILGAILAVLTPILMIFTGLCGVWFCTQDFEKDEEKSESPD
jgi:uncharacterized membrane protein YuzA (DUF378 family)